MNTAERASYRVLVADSEAPVRQVLAGLLAEHCHVSLASSREEALLMLRKQRVHVALLDENLLGKSSDAFLGELRQIEGDLPIVVLTHGRGGTEASAPAPSRSHFPKGLLGSESGRARLLLLVDRAADEERRTRELAFLRGHSARNAGAAYQQLGGKSAFSVALRERVAAAARSELNLLLTGETGVGKSLVAECVHRMSQGGVDRPFIVIQPTALPPSLFESELFGHVKGAFTGATGSQVGAFEAANGGTLFLDEIGELDPQLQVKLLHAVEGKAIRRIGDPREISLSVRVVAATNRDLDADVRDGKFRADLFERLNEIRLHLPPLRERREDVVPLLEQILAELSAEQGSVCRISEAAVAMLNRYDWPGNVRELRTLARRLREAGLPAVIDPEHLSRVFPSRATRLPPSSLSPEERVHEFKKKVYLEELEKHQFSIHRAAKAMDLPYPTLRSRLKTLGLLPLKTRN